MPWARISPSGLVFEITTADPSGRFAADIQWSAVPAGTVVNSQRQNDGSFRAPDEPDPGPPAPAPGRSWSPPRFMLQFTPAERVGIRASTDPVVQDWLAILADPRLASIEADDPDTRAAVAYLVSKGLLTGVRATEILGG